MAENNPINFEKHPESSGALTDEELRQRWGELSPEEFKEIVRRLKLGKESQENEI